jgi:ABC-2 type transport system permease protein
MLATLKSEFRKLLTIRSTYILTSLVIVAVGLIAYFLLGREQEAIGATNPSFLYDAMYTSLAFFATFSTIVAILHMTHEYRYSTIGYTLTASRSRVRVIAAKAIVLVSYALIGGAIVAVLGALLAKAGAESNGIALAAQTVDLWTIVWQLGAYVVGYTLVGLLLGMLVRSVVGAIVIFFTFPIAEQMLTLLLKENTKYLPFHSLDSIAATAQFQVSGALTHPAALGVFSLYFAVIGLIAIVLFVRRDAN